jgi:hypothetical protein
MSQEHAAGAFDVRNVIAGLIGLYGVVLVVMGLVADSDAAGEKTGGVNANLWAGIVMVVVAGGLRRLVAASADRRRREGGRRGPRGGRPGLSRRPAVSRRRGR